MLTIMVKLMAKRSCLIGEVIPGNSLDISLFWTSLPATRFSIDISEETGQHPEKWVEVLRISHPPESMSSNLYMDEYKNPMNLEAVMEVPATGGLSLQITQMPRIQSVRDVMVSGRRNSRMIHADAPVWEPGRGYM